MTATPLSASMALAISAAAPPNDIARAGAHDAHARLADHHALDAERDQAAPRRCGAAARRSACSLRPAVASVSGGSTPSPGATARQRLGLRAAHLHGVERGHRVGAGRQRLADIDARAARATAAPAHRSWRRCVELGAHAQSRRAAPARRSGWPAAITDVGGERAARRALRHRFLARRDRPDRKVEACQHVGERGQPRNPLDFGIRNHARNLTRYGRGVQCRADHGTKRLRPWRNPRSTCVG